MQRMQVVIGSDHAGFEFKKQISGFLKKHKFLIMDVGTHSADSCDYPDFAQKVAQKVSKNHSTKGILICGTGIGMSMVANRHKEIRAALCHSVETAQLARQHNNANILCLGARVTTLENAKQIAKTFLETPFSEQQRHQKRIEKMDQ